MLVEDTRPSEGIWYYVYLKPIWKLYVFKATEYGDMTHVDAWSKYLADIVAKHYKVNPDKVIGAESLRTAYLCMPRGRVFQDQKGKWIFNHGNDFPVPIKKAKKLLPAEFELTKQALQKMVEFRFEDHEVQDPHDVHIFKTLVGQSPVEET
jgi:hypothetical protein